MNVEVVARTTDGLPARVKVTTHDARSRGPLYLGTVAIGDAFRTRRRNGFWMRLHVFAFSSDGEYAYVERNTSRRKQPIRTGRLLRAPYERSSA